MTKDKEQADMSHMNKDPDQWTTGTSERLVLSAPI
jgi:hypothetical protein